MFTKTKAVGLMLSLFSANAMAITVTPTTDGNLLASTIVGSGITISNVNYIGGPTQSGTFTGGAGSIGIDEGIILTSGNATLAPGPNTNDGSTGVTGTGGDADLNNLIPQSTNDKAVLEFDFETTGGDLFFSWVFASEEYNEFVNSSFNDVFAFFVDGVDASDNIALAPNGDPASINNINCGNPFVGAGPNCAAFNNNDPTNGIPTPFDIEYDGFTDVITASALGLGAGTHSIKIAIADAGDSILDSAVFIKAGSFSDKPPEEAPEPGILALLGLGLAGMTVLRRRKRV